MSGAPGAQQHHSLGSYAFSREPQASHLFSDGLQGSVPFTVAMVGNEGLCSGRRASRPWAVIRETCFPRPPKNPSDPEAYPFYTATGGGPGREKGRSWPAPSPVQDPHGVVLLVGLNPVATADL